MFELCTFANYFKKTKISDILNNWMKKKTRQDRMIFKKICEIAVKYLNYETSMKGNRINGPPGEISCRMQLGI